jgi:hypothetical protein
MFFGKTVPRDRPWIGKRKLVGFIFDFGIYGHECWRGQDLFVSLVRHMFSFLSLLFLPVLTSHARTLSLTKQHHMNSFESPVAKAGSGSHASSNGHSTKGFCQFCTFGFGFHIQIAKACITIIRNWYESLNFFLYYSLCS